MRNYREGFPRKIHPAKVFFFLVMAAVFILVLGGGVMLLWNAILPEVVGAKAINFWQAIGLLLLARILFGGFRMGSFRGKSRGYKGGYWRKKWMNMSEEDRTKFKDKWKEYCNRKKEE